MIRSKDRVFFDKSKSYIRDYTAPALTANGAALSIAIATTVDLFSNTEAVIPIEPVIAFTLGLASAFCAHIIIWALNDNIRNSEQRDAMAKFYISVHDISHTQESEGGLTYDERKMMEGLPNQISTLQKRSLTPDTVSRASKSAQILYLSALFLFAIGLIWSIRAVYNLPN
ncbi:hypothetical protein [Roseibium polysiphoniae]|uniref:SMODS and SLOG-associating 2TM effector domain-containing protein n=1 Tax=Roseibium polysiphoniae TaxID=2571221 RepID=A0ABR9C754_9HYPH|nr:hypothetical protein [Roseibium polysiphoniae]MBD8875741.1 hypothetical protein [Roseibium polysiphoniae]